ncbi:MAG: hypothetical protein MN733_17815 [Nitrososphaera sp.]|nr:hypothetical protein [Nitrososphaera sp.]
MARETYETSRTYPDPESNRIVQEAERATVLKGFVIETDSTASGGKYIWLPNGSTSNGAEARFTFQVTTTGTYSVIGRVSAANAQDA